MSTDRRAYLKGLGRTISPSGATFTMHMDDKSLAEFDRQIYGIIDAVGSGARDLVERTTRAILRNSNAYVPVDTETLLESGYTRVVDSNGHQLKDLALRRPITVYTGIVGYGDDEQTGTINPKTGMRPSQYAWKVHEDLTAKHPNGGQAKFLERAFREYVASEYGPMLVRLQRNMYRGKRAGRQVRYLGNEKIVTFGKRFRSTTVRETTSNLDRLMDIYNSTRR